jgi:hypothetical protein
MPCGKPVQNSRKTGRNPIKDGKKKAKSGRNDGPWMPGRHFCKLLNVSYLNSQE